MERLFYLMNILLYMVYHLLYQRLENIPLQKFFHLMLVGTFLLMDLSIFAKMAAILLVVWSLYRLFHQRPELGQNGYSVTSGKDGKVKLQFHNRYLEANLEKMAAVTRYLVVLNYSVDGRNDALLLFRDAMSDDAHRKLRIWCKHHIAKKSS